MTAVASLTHIRVVMDYKLQRSTKLNISQFCQKNIVLLHCFLTHSQPFNETFIFSGKFSCCNGTFAIYIAAGKEYLTKGTLFLDI